MKAYEAVCQPVCKRYQLNQTCLDVILFLANNPEYNTAKDLWEIRGIRSGNASVAIETLVRRGYLKREADAQDRRLQRLILTERANEAIAMGRQAQRVFGEQMMSGITEKEIHDNLEEELHQLAEKQKMSYEQVCAELKECYDGYHFMEHTIGIYNPFSLLNTFDKMKFGSYWFETGTPTYLVNLLKKHHYDLERMAHEETDEQVLNSIDSESSNPIPVIYQSGYLTIKGYDEEFGIYRLGFPNREVEEGFVRFLLPYYANVNKVESPFEIQKFVREVRSGDYNSFFRRLQSFFADTGYDVIREQELHYENVLFIVFKLVGFYTKVEYHTSEGRIDLVLQTDKFIYVMEFKLNGTAEEALKQINEKHYSLPFEADNRKLFKVGVNFSSQTRNIEKWIVEE